MATGPIGDRGTTADWNLIQTQMRRRLVWKENRLLLPVCTALWALAVVGMLLVVCFPANSIEDNAAFFAGLILAGINMIAVVCGSLAFSPERENRTDLFLSRLPLSGQSLIGTKVGMACLYFFSFYLFTLLAGLGLFATCFGANLTILAGKTNVLGEMLPICLLEPVVLFFVSLLLSRYFEKTINAVMMTVAILFAIPVVISTLIELLNYFSGDLIGLNGWFTNPVFLGVAVLGGSIAMVSGTLYGGHRWLRPSNARESAATNRSGNAMTNSANVGRLKPASPMKSLLWQTYHFHKLSAIAVLILCMLSIWIGLTVILLFTLGTPEDSILSIELINDFFAALVGAGVGLFLFMRDQSGQSCRFFSQYADYPRRLWLARILFLMVAGMAVYFSISLINHVLISTHTSMVWTKLIGEYATGVSGGQVPYLQYDGALLYSDYHLFLTFRSVTTFFLVASIGQLISIFCRHGIVAAVLGTACCLIALAWMRMINWFLVPTIAYAWPVTLTAFILSWWYAPAWIRGTRQLRCSVIAAGVMIAVIVTCAIMLRRDRLNDYPVSTEFAQLDRLILNPEQYKQSNDPKFKPAQDFDSAAGKIMTAWAEIKPEKSSSRESKNDPHEFSAEELELVNQLSREFEVAVNSLKHPDVRYAFFQPVDAAPSAQQAKRSRAGRILKLYQVSMRKNNKGKKLRNALVAEFGWEMVQSRPYLSFRRLNDILRWADQPQRTATELREMIIEIRSVAQMIFESRIAMDREDAYWNFERHQLESARRESILMPHRWPWEVERESRRLHFYLLQGLDGQLTDGYFSGWGPAGPRRDLHAFQLASPQERIDPWLASNKVVSYLIGRLALAAWKLDHGQYPQALAQLDKDIFSPIEIKDINSFSYFHTGLDLPVFLNGRRSRLSSHTEMVNVTDDVIKPRTPFLLPWFRAANRTSLFLFNEQSDQDLSLAAPPQAGYDMIPNERQAKYYWGIEPEIFILGQRDDPE